MDQIFVEESYDDDGLIKQEVHLIVDGKEYIITMDGLCSLGDRLKELAEEQAAWSQATFGHDSVRGPLGALKHLEKEAREAQADPTDKMEYADCFLLILDAARRAGISAIQLILLSLEKMKINKEREWPKPTSDEPVEHLRG